MSFPQQRRGGRVAPIRSVADLDGLLQRSGERPVWIFKHSLTCSVSSVARDEFQAFVDETADSEAEFGLIEVQSARPASNALAERSGVRHESPQAILYRRRRPVWHASHWAITRSSLAGAQAGASDGG